MNDGRLKKKGKRLENPKAKDDYPTISPILKQFIAGDGNELVSVPAFQKLCGVNWADKALELIPEAYLDEPSVTTAEIADAVDQLMRGSIAFRIQFEKQLAKLDK